MRVIIFSLSEISACKTSIILQSNLAQCGNCYILCVTVVVRQGYDVVDVFHRLCLYTTDRQVRDTLSEMADLLTDDERDALAFVRHLETICPQRSFETAKRRHQRQNRSLQLIQYWFKILLRLVLPPGECNSDLTQCALHVP